MEVRFQAARGHFAASCPLYPQKRTLEALQSFGLKKRTSDVRFTPESGHKWLGRGMSAYDPKRTFSRICGSVSTCSSKIIR